MLSLRQRNGTPVRARRAPTFRHTFLKERLSPEYEPMQTAKQPHELEQRFSADGYLVVSNVVPADKLAQLYDAILREYERKKAAGQLFSGGGTISGHLNCFPGEQSRFVYQALCDAGIVDLIGKLSPAAVRLPNVGCNLNLAGSCAQNMHIDGYAAEPFMIANVAVVDTDLVNGAIEISPGSHRRDYKYWEFVLARHQALRVQMKAGDVLLRTSTLWHRGMPNRSSSMRPMLGFSWEDGGSRLEDPYSIHDGQIAILTNRYAPNFSGRLKERAFAALPALGSAYLFVRSLR